MFTIILSLEDDNIWNSYFKSQFTGQEIKSCQNCNLPAGQGQYYLDECNFFDDNNRVIYFDPVKNSLFLHNRCSFSNCTSTSSGSCIYFKIGSNSSIVQRKFCCTKCQSQGKGQFSYTLVDRDNLNFFMESSLFDVGKESVGCSIEAERDNIVVSSTNFSSCKASWGPAGWLKSPNVNYTTKYNYTTVVNNLATFIMILSIWYNALIDSCNIINNTTTQSDFGIIHHQENSLTVKSCSFINNTGPEDSSLIFNSNYGDPNEQTTVDSCYIDNSTSSTFLRNVVLTNPRELFTNKLIHLSTGNCQAEFAIIKKTKCIEYFSHRFPCRR
ncbi:hypothetical protein TVAG_227260 [Trichomonas vaginalis G3]|uniref:Right handed beta helix domain-containing protein n=1 Tax=Trichomonas vaginalis (strain ATCC PRA-98 / G3) TaxID=412133 RepID=A2GA19_TRIV3|nr:hypothetical protein TVAGG3_0142090 [Trichomonas vaginalis G3]EAX86000.1 hypothetical protein TVAG_227260 [Trichomonas vaginalis G3]KAI5546655.1 hypothetical protein TVAGG3_0142090 [Trichomonas vaginalis G3]|eukprot:XP_001298930.1 hypothetical protein [Trichomonas vaginalis G3]